MNFFRNKDMNSNCEVLICCSTKLNSTFQTHKALKFVYHVMISGQYIPVKKLCQKVKSVWLANKRMNTLSKAARLSLSLEQNAN